MKSIILKCKPCLIRFISYFSFVKVAVFHISLRTSIRRITWSSISVKAHTSKYNQSTIPVTVWFPVKNADYLNLLYADLRVSDDFWWHFMVQMKGRCVLIKWIRWYYNNYHGRAYEIQISMTKRSNLLTSKTKHTGYSPTS